MSAREAKILAKIMAASGETLALAESCTGGLIGAMLTEVPGSSKWFQGSIVAYGNGVKTNILDVKASVIRKSGAVSEQTAALMAKGALKKLKAGYAAAVTGIAGPSGGTKDKPVGTVYIAVCDRKRLRVQRFNFKGSRTAIRKKTASKAVWLLKKFIAG
ncbi:MAG: nicotinamide-nucleotide amidohydrolase family protein [Deltaproteobacteria bacterium]|nr:nicotinamide-nucleotide amidohydrolase family protein [Deltaproteobacteria bacterium]